MPPYNKTFSQYLSAGELAEGWQNALCAGRWLVECRGCWQMAVRMQSVLADGWQDAECADRRLAGCQCITA